MVNRPVNERKERKKKWQKGKRLKENVQGIELVRRDTPKA
jgi:hypothetical protein